MKKILIFWGVALIIMIIVIGVKIKIKDNDIIIGYDEKPIASMRYSYDMGIDAGIGYYIDIYISDEDTYKYQATKWETTVVGSKEVDKTQGLIKSKKDLVKLDKFYKKKKVNNSSVSIKYRFSNEKEFESIDELARKMYSDSVSDDIEASGFSERELDYMEYVDSKINDMTNLDSFKNGSIDERKKLAVELLKELKKEKYINHYDYDESNSMFDFEYECGVSGGIMLRDFDPLLN